MRPRRLNSFSCVVTEDRETKFINIHKGITQITRAVVTILQVHEVYSERA